MRALFLFILCLTTPFQGIAIAHADKPPCPMANSSLLNSSMLMDQIETDNTNADEQAGDDCCNDEATFALTGERCKSGQSCTSGGGISLLTRFELSLFAAEAQADFIFPPTLPLRLNLASIWRPPSTITP